MSKTTKKILIAGYYGFGNTGDEAILTAMIQDLKIVHSNITITVVSGNPQDTLTTHEVDAILWTDIKTILGTIQNCDLVILGGGGLFHDYWTFDPTTLLTSNHSGIAFYSGIALMASLLRKPLMIYAVGVGPIFSDIGKEYTRFAFNQAQLITVRDRESKILLSTLGISQRKIKVTADPAFRISSQLGAENIRRTYKTEGPLLCAALRNWDIGVSQNRWENEVAKALDIFTERNAGTVLFLPFQVLSNPSTNDIMVAERVRERMLNKSRTRILRNMMSSSEKMGVISQCELVLGMRLHSIIFAINAGVPAVALEYDEKVRNIMARTHLENFSIKLDEVDAGSLANHLDRIHRHRFEMIKQFTAIGTKLKKLALENTRLAVELLDHYQDVTLIANTLSPAILSQVILSETNLIANQEFEIKKRDSWIKERDRIISDYQSALENKEKRIDKLNGQLYEIHNSRYWNFLSHYWNLREDITSGYARLRNWIRGWVPITIRRWLVHIYRRIGIKIPADINLSENFTKQQESDPEYTGYDVICLPIIDWQFRYQRPQQLLSRFAQDKHRCFYIKPTYETSKRVSLLREIDRNIYEVNLPGLLGINIYSDEISKRIENKLLEEIDLLRNKASIIEAIIIVELPFWLPIAQRLQNERGWKIIYDCMDDHSGFSTNSPKMLQQENELIRTSDLVASASQSLFKKCIKLNNRTIYLPNATDFEHFNQQTIENPLPEVQSPIIGYYGAISEWFDSGLIRTVAIKHPEWQFILIGDTFGANLEELRSISTIHLLGEKNYHELPGYLSRFNVACIPFKLTPLTLATNPVKFYEYLSAGKPVVAPELPELAQYKKYYYPYHSIQEFEDHIIAALQEETSEVKQARIHFAQENTWKDRYICLNRAIHDIYRKAVVIVISYNNMDYLRLCLNSIWKKTIYPNLEVIVVDNGSRDDTITFLKTMEAREPRLKVLYNKENFGFARANNLGIEASGECEYIVLLNDDVVVTHGWLVRLLRHLNDPLIKMVGPVTNWAGNEARIATQYNDLDAMEQFAQQYCTLHEDQSFDIPMLAMFSVAMRKSLIDEIGFLDEQFGIGMFEDDDFSLRIHKIGGKTVCAEDVYIHHWGSATLSRMNNTDYDRLFNENRKKFEAKWGIKWQPHQSRL